MHCIKKYFYELLFVIIHLVLATAHIIHEFSVDGLHWNNLKSINGLFEILSLLASIGSFIVFVSMYSKINKI